MTEVPKTQDAAAECLMGEIVDEFLERLGRGERPDVEDYAQHFPQLAVVLRQMLPALQVIHLSAADPRRAAENTTAVIEPEGPLGDFRIVREIGRGGMGVVYEAVQISLGRRVALKVLPFTSALDAKQLQRFKNEAHAAAHLHHQHIVPVYAVGGDRGVHYYAMQYIEGQTLAALIEALHHSLEARSRPDPQPLGSEIPQGNASPAYASLPDGRGFDPTLPVVGLSTERSTRSPAHYRMAARLGVQAAEGLDHAHQLGVVHRDIKPANLLVDDRGNLWITDFGLAHCQSQAGLTMTGDLVGTLRYMSPEQALGRTAAVDHRTDIYSLGATIYELLALRPVFDGRDRQELLHRIASEEPCPLRRLNRGVPVELEIIVQKALEKDAEARYATAQELADDLRRFLEDKPIRARRPSWLDRTRKWARRHRPAVWWAAAALVVAITLLAANVGWVVRDRAASRAKVASDLQTALDDAQRLRTEGKWPQAQAAAQRAESLLEDGVTEPALSERVRAVLRELAEEEADIRLVARLDEIRLLQAGVNVKEDRFAMEDTLPEFRQAFSIYGLRADLITPEDAAALIRRRPPSVHGALVAALDHWLILACYANAPEVDWLKRVLSAADSDSWRQRLRTARLRNDRQTLEKLARGVDAAAQPPQELFLLDRALHQRGAEEGAVALLQRAQKAFPGDFWINHDLGMALKACQPPQHEEAIRFLTAAVALRPGSAGARLNLGVAFLNTDRLDEAIETFCNAIELKNDYAMAHNNLGCALARKGQLDDAIAAWRRAAELKPDLVLAHDNLASALWRMQRLDEALAAFRRVVELQPDCADSHCSLGCCLWKMDRPDETIAAFGQAVKLKPDSVEAHFNLGIAFAHEGRVDEALAAYGRAIDLKPDYADAHFNLGLALERKGRLGDAVPAFRRVVDLKPDYAGAHYNLGNALREKGRLDEAVAAYRQAVELQPDFAEGYCNLGLILQRQGDFARSLDALKEGHKLGTRRPDWPYPSAEWVRECRRQIELEERLPAIVQGEDQPASAAERNEFALLCYHKNYYVAAARFWADAFTADPNLADDVSAGRRAMAASAAVLASAGQGVDPRQLDDKERVCWRKQAVDWLRADLAANAKLLASAKPQDRWLVQQRLRSWQCGQDFAGLRDASALADLSTDEQKACKLLWAEVDALLTKADDAK
jgi:serine/threonine protein kinase/Flp pilus assembly protein TadD